MSMQKSKITKMELILNDISDKYKKKIYDQKYLETISIDGVKLINLKSITGEEGDLSEIIRINSENKIESLPEFKIAQINRTRLIPGSIKAWHLHFKQDFVWYVSPHEQLFVGLWDLRKKSKTENKVMRIILGGGNSQLLFIPHGVAQGSAVFNNTPVDLYVFSNFKFDKKNLDEKRLSWDSKGKQFWFPKKD